jgi:hypothetical protein
MRLDELSLEPALQNTSLLLPGGSFLAVRGDDQVYLFDLFARRRKSIPHNKKTLRRFHRRAFCPIKPG